MKAIVSLMQDDGKYADVGCINRHVVSGDLRSIVRQARDFARGRGCQIEFFHEDHFYGDRVYVQTMPGPASSRWGG